MFLCCDGMQSEGPRENSEDTSPESETMKECSPCVEAQKPGQVPTRKCTKSIRREFQQKCPQPHDHPYWRSITHRSTSTWATIIAGKRKNRSSVDKQDVWYHPTKKVGMKVHIEKPHYNKWMRTTLNGKRWQSRYSSRSLAPDVLSLRFHNYNAFVA